MVWELPRSGLGHGERFGEGGGLGVSSVVESYAAVAAVVSESLSGAVRPSRAIAQTTGVKRLLKLERFAHFWGGSECQAPGGLGLGQG
jgi:hypothetical protein